MKVIKLKVIAIRLFAILTLMNIINVSNAQSCVSEHQIETSSDAKTSGDASDDNIAFDLNFGGVNTSQGYTVSGDTDGDGITDNIDLDDDNDGIRDVDENATYATSIDKSRIVFISEITMYMDPHNSNYTGSEILLNNQSEDNIFLKTNGGNSFEIRSHKDNTFYYKDKIIHYLIKNNFFLYHLLPYRIKRKAYLSFLFSHIRFNNVKTQKLHRKLINNLFSDDAKEERVFFPVFNYPKIINSIFLQNLYIPAGLVGCPNYTKNN